MLALWWWPAAAVTVVLTVTSARRVRAGVEVYAQLLEATTRLHLVDLARQLGVDHTGPATAELGDQLYLLLSPAPSERPDA